MILKNKKVLILSSLLTLLPIPVGLLLWNRFPEYMTTHLSLTGEPDGWGSIGFSVFITPLMMLAVHWICIFFTAKDPGNKERNRKPLTMVLWIIPFISNLCSGLMYALSMGAVLPVPNVMIAAMGLMFVVIGNYLPKCRMNSTMGIKVPWAYTSQENWNATHRFGGRVWLVGGLIMMLSAFLPGEFGIVLMIIATFVLAIVPTVYSFVYYRKQKKQGIPLLPMMNTTDRKVLIVTGVFLVLLLAGVAVLMFTGDITLRCDAEALVVEASWYSDLTVDYEVMESVEYREGNVPGARVGGFGSARLLMGFFQNEEFGTYTRYTYTSPEACLVIRTDRQVLVLSGRTADETRSLYESLLENIS